MVGAPGFPDGARNGPRDQRALETLLAYNATDVVNLEALLVKAYNLKLQETPFSKSHQVAEPVLPVIPFTADHNTIQRLKHSTAFGYYGWR